MLHVRVYTQDIFVDKQRKKASVYPINVTSIRAILFEH